MSADSAVTYTSVHSEAQSWSIPSEDPYEEAARRLLEQAPRSPEYVPDPMELEDHVLVYIPEPEHLEELVPAEDEAPTPLLPPFFLSLRIRPPHTRAAMRQMTDIPEADTPPRKRLLLTTPRPSCEVGESSAAAAARQPGPTMAHRVDHSHVDTMETRFRDIERRMMTALEMVNMRVSYQVDVRSRESSEFYTRHHDAQKDRAAVRAEIEVLRRERLAYEQESIQTRQDLARSEAHCRALEARVTVLETDARRHEWQRQAADDLAVQYIMRTQALEAGARVDTLEDTGVAAAMAEAEASRVRNGYNSNGSGPRPAQTARECSYSEFLKCKPLDFKGTEGVVGLTRWFEKMESVFSISNCTASCQVKFVTCTLQDDALTWWNAHVKTTMLRLTRWNAHVKTTTPEAAHAMPWAALKKMMADKYCPRGEIKKIETKTDTKSAMWLEMQGKPSKVVGGIKRADSDERYPLPERIDDLFDQLQGSSVYSKIDLRTSKNTKSNTLTASLELLYQKLWPAAPILAITEGSEDFIDDAKLQEGFGRCVCSHTKRKGNANVIADAFEQEEQEPTGLRNEDVGGNVGWKTLKIRGDFDRNVGTHVADGTLCPTMAGVLVTSHKRTGQCKRPFQTLEDMLRALAIDFGKGWVNYLPLTEVGEAQILGLELIQETTEKIVQIKQRMQATQDRQKSYADLKCKPMEFQVGDKGMLKVSPWKGVVRLGKRRKLNPRYIGPFKVLEKVGEVAYKLDLPEEVSRVHNTFHVSNLKKCHADEPLAVPLDGIHLMTSLFVEEAMSKSWIREVKRVERSRIH
ncbi:hypothetical protein Tco_0439937 [Tanacetum coccineum]